MPRNKAKNTARAAAHRAEKEAQRNFERRIMLAISGCSSERVARAVNSEDYGLQIVRATKRLEKEFNRDAGIDGGACLPDVALYAAGHRGKTKSIYQAR